MMANQDTEQLPSEYYHSGSSDRQAYIDRAERYANLTIPSVFRDSSWSSSSTKADTYVQSFGAIAVKNLVSKIGMTLFPPNASSFRFTPDADGLKALTEGDPAMVKDIQLNISQSQNNINRHLEALNTRKTIFEVLEQLAIVSSCIIEKKDKGGYKLHNLRNFVVTLDDEGNAFKMCIEESLNKLPSNIEEPKESKEKYELYTMLEKEGSTWTMTQELEGEIVNTRTYSEEKMPFEYVGWLWSQGDAYYRPYVEDFEGNLQSIDALQRVLTKGSLIASKNITFVDERGGRTRLRDVIKAGNGAVLQGNAADVTSYQHGKNYDYQVAISTLDQLKRELSQAFLLTEGLRRDAERVTQAEIRMLSQEIETALASVYSVISNKLIKRMVLWAMGDLGIKFEAITLDIVTGLDALGRSVEAGKLDEYVSRAASIGFMDYLKQDELAARYATLYNIDSDQLLKTSQQVQQERQQAQQAAAQQAGQQAMSESAGGAAGQAMVDAVAQQS